MSTPPAEQRPRRAWLRPALAAALFIAANVLLYLLIPPAIIERVGALGYPGAFLVAALANATLVVPVPYFPILVRLGQSLSPLGVTLAAAAGSALGETAAYLVGRSGRGAVTETPLYRWTQAQLRRPWRAPLILFALSAPPNPTFDVAGILAGALGVPLPVFLVSVFLGRIVRMGLVIWLGGLLP